ncbi:phytanoyl-CoA dioxygenase family protein [Roseomonas marmotae]|uniref:Phytanoyl-CoA dioxygenase family protein n=1 Tax=Roseomonas marmotae TaxID=2768161 RepID=A0ABS3K6C6_9PROT|nr:phytanoyl-CoA dioxygenase family protein [Roseomonas marmotae]MBO1073000.1 phytanoyl-CoA dioxygenase family protein [Roseomonas marmotae]QTI79352.1 phytanoyl-CoA dioxygenase family protein [Roseomonas marmotae]
MERITRLETERRGPGAGLRWLLLPWHAARVLSGEKSFRANPLLGSELLNRRGLHIWRVRLAQRMAGWRRRRMEHLVSPRDREDFARDGFVQVPDFLEERDFQALVARLSALSTEAHEMREGKAVTRRIPITTELLRQAPELRAFLAHPRWRGLTRYVSSFDAAPLTFIQVILSGASGEEDPQTRLHMDTFHPTMKAWFFLHAVEMEEGPLTYVARSHIQGRRRQAWQRRRSTEAARRREAGGAFRVTAADLTRFGLERPRHFAVPGNTLVVADTCGFHARGASARESIRVEIYASSRPNPFSPLLRPLLDRVPALEPWRVPAQYWVQDRLAALGLLRPVWRPVGKVPVFPPHGAGAGAEAGRAPVSMPASS